MSNLRITILISLCTHGIVLASGIMYYGTKGIPTKQQNVIIPISFITSPQCEHNNQLNSTVDPVIVEKKNAIQLPKKTLKTSHNAKNKQIKNATSSSKSKSNICVQDCKPFIENEYPLYPEEAKQQGLEAKFLAYLKVNTKGFVEEINFYDQSIPLPLKKATQRALKSWKFYRTKNTNAYISVPIEFVLSGE
jgi:outer membrane biosynthesis protein TonB